MRTIMGGCGMRFENQPVSVVMPVRNALPFLDEAIASILAQSHGNFEFVIGDDGSTDGSSERLECWARRDSRIRLLRNDGPCLGPAESSNWVVRESIHPLVARMDGDDLSMPDRLGRQLAAFDEHPDAVIAGTLSETIDAKGRRVVGRDRSVLRNKAGDYPVAHGSIMFRRDAFEQAGGYRAICDFWEDRDLLIRMVRSGKALILPQALYRYRYSGTSCRIVAEEARLARALDLRLRCLAALRSKCDYDDILREEQTHGPPPSVAPAVLAQIAVERLWRGEPRKIMRSWTRRNTALRWDRRGILIRAFAAWAWINPASLRTVLRLRSRHADWRSRHLGQNDTVQIWTSGPGEPHPVLANARDDRGDGSRIAGSAFEPAAAMPGGQPHG
jgi:glycosyltransferase involved in cell wall biosynthesis